MVFSVKGIIGEGLNCRPSSVMSASCHYDIICQRMDPLALHSNLNLKGIVYPMTHLPTRPCYTIHQQFPLLSIAHVIQ